MVMLKLVHLQNTGDMTCVFGCAFHNYGVEDEK